MEELDIIINNMIKAGESDEAIRLVIQSYEQEQITPVQEVEPVKKKEITELVSPSEEDTSVSDGSEVSAPGSSIQDAPIQLVNEPVAQLYDQYIQQGKIKPAQQTAIENKIKAQEAGDRGLWETAIAMTEGFIRTGIAVPIFQYDKQEDLVRSRELKNKVDFLSELPEETVSELKSYAGGKIADLEGENMNVLAENKILEEKGKQLSNTLKKQGDAIKELQQMGREVPEEGVRQYQETYNELTALSGAYNSNVDILENNIEDVGDFYEEVNLLKKNYGGLDYYADLIGLTAGAMVEGVKQFEHSTVDIIENKTGINVGLGSKEEQLESKRNIRKRRNLTNKRLQEDLRPRMSVSDIEEYEDFGAWLGEQVATQLPVITVLAASGGGAGLGVLGVSAAGQKIGELEDERASARETKESISDLLKSGVDISEEEYDELDKTLRGLRQSLDISDDEMYIAGLGTGALEVLTEKVTLGILSKGKRAFLAAKKAGGNSFKEFSKGIGRNIAAGMEEGGAEFVNQFGGNLIDIMYLNDPDIHVFDGTLDALASGTALGFGMRAAPSGIGMGVKAFQNKAKTADIKTKSQKVSDLLTELETNSETIDEKTKKILEKKVSKLKKEISKDIKSTFNEVSEMSKTDIQGLIDLDKAANKISNQVKDLQKSDLSEGLKTEIVSELKEELDKIVNKKQEILDKEKASEVIDSPLKRKLRDIEAPQKIIDAIRDDTEISTSFFQSRESLKDNILNLLTTRGYYIESQNRIWINKLYGKDKNLLLHEAVHAATVASIRDVSNNPENYSKSEVKAVKELRSIAFDYYLSTPTLAKLIDPAMYGTTHAYEFVSEFISNKKFRDWVDKNNPTKSRNVVQHIWKRILQSLGLSGKQINQERIEQVESLIDQTLDISIKRNKKDSAKQKKKEFPAPKVTKEDTQDNDSVESKNNKTTSIEDISRTFRIINPFKQGKPLVEVPLNQTLDAALDNATQKIVDRFFPVKKIQKSIESKLGKKLPKEQNFRQAEIAMHGKAATKLQDFADVTQTLIKDTVKSDLIEAKGKTKVDRLSDYLMARHAQERNAHIRKIPLKDPDNQEVNEAGSGMTDAEAQSTLDSFKGTELAAVEKLAERVDTIMEETRQVMLDGGLITELQKDVLTNYYDNYVPLQGFESNDLSSDMASAFGLSLSVKGKEGKRAAGRTTKADNVIANIIGFRNNMIVRSEKNAVMQSLHEMVKQNPDPEVWKTFSKSRPDVMKGLTSSGKVGDIVQNMSNTDKYVGVKIKGEQHYIKFGNERLAQVINAASVEKTDIMTKTMGKFNRYLSTVLTTYNPEFMISNALRDIQAAIINQASERDISNNSLQDKSFIKATVASTVPAIKTIFNSERGKDSNTELGRYYREFKEDGAKTDWFYAKNVEGIKKDIQKMIKAESKGKNLASGSIDAVKAIGKLLDDGNTAVENGVRLASYMEARKAGVTRADAAEFAKELTINFNQKGEWGTLANTMFLFFNASVQGTVRFSKAMTTFKKTVQDDGSVKYGLNRAQKIAAALTAASAINTMLNILTADEDEDGVSFYDKIPDYEKERNLIIMNPNSTDGDYFKIPLPYGYNVFHNLGTVATEVSMGNRDTGDGVGFMINSLVGAFNPLNMPDSKSTLNKYVKAVLPTILKPAFELAINESHFGSTIYNENFPVGTPKPDSQLGRATTNEWITEATKFLNEATGGSEYVSGWVDINPDKIEHIFEFMGGGTSKFVLNSLKTGDYVLRTAEGEEVEIKARQIPFLRKVFGEPSEFISKEIYYDRKTEIDQLYDEYKSDVSGNKGKERYKGIVALKNRQKVADKRLKALRKYMKKLDKIEDPIKKSQKMKEAKDKETKIINSFNKRYNELRLGL